MKKKWILIPALVLSVACAVGGTLAYFTHSETAHNVITAGNVEIALVEKQLAENGKEVDYPEDPIENVMPGTKVSKIVRVEKQVIEVMAEAIQSGPANAVGDSWGVSISEGSVTAYQSN